MKSLVLVILMMLSTISFTFSQDGKDIDKQLNTALEQMTKEDKAKALGYALSLDGKVDKKLKKALKKLSDKDKAMLLEVMSINKAPEKATISSYEPPGPAKPAGSLTALEFSEMEYNFGTITEGEKVTHVFKFTNTGKEPLVISNAKGSCGCTVPQWPKDPIAPGKTGEIKVQFNSKNKKGKQTKTITITANTDPVNTLLRIKAEVLESNN